MPQAKELSAWLFQSTLPVRGATGRRGGLEIKTTISIHAPRAGSDADYELSRLLLGEFQSTLPVRGATVSIHNPAL